MIYQDLIPEFVVSDIEKSSQFYIDLLGFSLEYERPEDKFIFLSLGKVQLMLEEASKDELAQLSYPFGAGTNFSLGLDNVEDIYQRLVKASYPIKRDLEVRHFRIDDELVAQKEFSVLDPDGYFWRITD